ncbi:hypothetical protein SESBI_47244 [Sesbania bispinosa]|nr:hypothetical protein SESBI_47244 [Sesbania bispinosa]
MISSSPRHAVRLSPYSPSSFPLVLRPPLFVLQSCTLRPPVQLRSTFSSSCSKSPLFHLPASNLGKFSEPLVPASAWRPCVDQRRLVPASAWRPCVDQRRLVPASAWRPCVDQRNWEPNDGGINQQRVAMSILC